MAFELAEIVAQLVQAIGTGGEVEAGENGVVDLLGGPAANLSAAMQEDFEEADKTGVVDLDAGIADGADGDREGKALEQREVDMNIERRRPLAHPAGRQSRVFLFLDAGHTAPGRGGLSTGGGGIGLGGSSIGGRCGS